MITVPEGLAALSAVLPSETVITGTGGGAGHLNTVELDWYLRRQSGVI